MSHTDLDEQLKSLNHHAYAIIGGDAIQAELIEILEKQHSFKIHGNADLFNEKYTNFTIDNAREVKASHLTRPVSESGKKIFIMQMDSITVEAQNALLKLLEEPADYAIFFIIIPSSHLLIPTVKSRLCLINIVGRSSHLTAYRTSVSASDTELSIEVDRFMKAPTSKRLEMIKALMSDITDEKKPKQDAVDFLNAIQSVVYKQKGARIGKSSLEAIEVARKYMNDRSPSLKMLLEYVALIM